MASGSGSTSHTYDDDDSSPLSSNKQSLTPRERERTRREEVEEEALLELDDHRSKNGDFPSTHDDDESNGNHWVVRNATTTMIEDMNHHHHRVIEKCNNEGDDQNDDEPSEEEEEKGKEKEESGLVLWTENLLPTQQWEDAILHQVRARRQRHETHVSRLSIQVQRLQAALSRETKRRVASMADMEQRMERRFVDLEQRFAEQLEQQQTHFNEGLSNLEDRLNDLDARWIRHCDEVTHTVASHEREWTQQLDNMRAALAQESHAARDRHQQQQQQLHRLESRWNAEWKHERQERLSSVHTLMDRIEHQDNAATSHVKDLQAHIGTELALLKEELERETQERQAGDDEIVAGLNRYMEQIQKSLQYI